MKITKLWIKEYKNLKDFTINFEHQVSVIIWANGSWKSTILEILTFIFSALYEGKKTDFIYKIEYSINSKSYSFEFDWKKYIWLTDEIKANLPKRIIAYYS